MTFTTEEKERLLVWLTCPSPITKACDWLCGHLYRYSDNVIGYSEGDPIDDSYATMAGWPLRARLAALVGHRLDDLGRWANRRKAARRLARKAAA